MNLSDVSAWVITAGTSIALTASWLRTLSAERVKADALKALMDGQQELFDCRRQLAIDQRRRDQLTDNVRRLKAITDSAPAIVAHLDCDLRYISANEEFRRCLGLDPVVLVGRTLRETRGEAVYAQMENHLSAVLAGKTRQFEVTDTIHGVRHDFQHSFVPDLDDMGTVRGVYSVAFDVTELRRTQNFLLRTGSVAGIGGWEVNLGSGVVTWSDEVRRIHEVEPGYAPNLPDSLTFYTPESRPVIERAVQQGISAGESWDLELQLVTATGRLTWVRVLGDTDFVNNRAVRIVGTIQNITQRKVAQLKVEQQERILRSITDHLPVIILYVDFARNVRFINATAGIWLDLSQTEALDKPLEASLGTRRYQEQRSELERSLRGEHVRFKFDDVTRGKMRQFEIHYAPDFLADGTVAGIYVVATDIVNFMHDQQASDVTARNTAASDTTFRHVAPTLPERAREMNTGVAERLC